ncbi:hypothetical protein D3C72_1355400 [compost metagenome]
MKARILSVSVMATAPTPVSSCTIWAILRLASGVKPWVMIPRVRLAMVSALAEKTRENFSYIRCWSRIMLMKSAAPQELARIMGVAMVRTSCRACSDGVATSSMMTICRISA